VPPSSPTPSGWAIGSAIGRPSCRAGSSIARALANDPAIILADEPTGNLDTATGDQVMTMIGDLNAEGRTILMVTHEAEVAAHAPSRLHMRDGKIDRVEHD